MEKLTYRSRFALILTILIAPFAGVSAAGLIDLNSSAASNAAATRAAVDATVRGNVNTNAQVNGNVDAGVNNDTHASADVDANSNTSVTNTQGSEHANANARENANNNSSLIRVTRSDAESADTITQDMTASNVSTEADLKAYAATSLRNDANLSLIGFASDRVEVAYREPARFLGFIPMGLNVSVIAHSDGTVDVDYPWYSFLMLTHRADIESSIKNEVGAYMSQMHASDTAQAHASSRSALNATTTATSTVSGGDMNASASWNASARAALVARIQAILRAHLSATATSTAQTY